MAAAIRAHDWTATPLGPLAEWPQSLRTIVDLMLAARQPVYVGWGAEVVSLYNDAFIPILGDKHPGGVGQPFTALWPEIWEEFQPLVGAVMAGEAQHFTDRPVALAGRKGVPMTWVTYSWTPLRDEAGRIAGFYAALTETTDKLRAEERQRLQEAAALRESEWRYQTLIEAMDQAFCAIEVLFDAGGRPEDYRFLEVNPAFERHTGLHGATGKRARELVPGLEPSWFETYGRVALTGEPTRIEDYVADLVGGVWYDAYAFRIGRPEQRRVAVIFNDITARRRAEAALRASEERLRLIVENARDYAIYIADADDRIETWLPGAAHVFGWSEAEVVGCPAAITFTLEDRAAGAPEAEVEIARRDGTAPNVRWQLRKDGTRVFIEGSTTALRNLDGSIRGFLKIGQDVTARKASEERQALLAREVDHRAKNALAVVQAALRLTPKTSIENYAAAVQGRVAALARAQTLLAEERWNGAGLRALLMGELAPFVGGQRVDLDGPPVVLPAGTAQPLTMAIHELATNALKHGALSVPGGRVSVSWRYEGNMAGVLRLRWAETGGPKLTGAPARRGFGSRVLDGTVRGQLGGTVSLAWDASGLVSELMVPLGRHPRVVAEDDLDLAGTG
jgi:PAS domain S-box-containing protein